jgi:translation initiation factor 2B subunit (eIF-2B alpha/beta/delta family)
VGLAVRAIEITLRVPAEERGEVARALLSMHRAIVTVANVGRRIEQGATEEELRALKRSLQEGNGAIAVEAAKLVGTVGRVVTLSDSSTVEAVVRALRPKRVLVLESRPGGEGVRLAKRLDAEVVTDAEMGLAVEQADCALVGIDAFDSSGAILHKIGTLPLALCCQHFGRPFYALGHSFKLAPGAVEELLEPEAPFDRTPPGLVTAIVTEKGVIHPWAGKD